MRVPGQKTTGPLAPFVLAGLIALVGFAGAVNLARLATALGPGVGDIVAFNEDHHGPRDMDAQLSVARSVGGDCIIDVAAMRDGGGSLVVEERLMTPARAYRVHWSGRLTSRTAQDCGAEADLILHDNEMGVLALAAGGYGVTGHDGVLSAKAWKRAAAE